MDQAVHTLKVDPELVGLIPPLAEDELRRLEESVAQEGCRDALLTWNEVLVDGHNRYDICHRNQVPFSYREIAFKDKDAAKAWIINNQLARRNLNAYQRSALALKLKNILEGEAKERQGTRSDLHQESQNIRHNYDGSWRTDEQVAKAAGVSRGTIRKVEAIEEKADEETKQQLQAGKVSVNKAFVGLDGGGDYGEAGDVYQGLSDDEESTELRVEGINKAGTMNYVVKWSDGRSSSVTRSRLLDEGYKKCPHCSGYGVVPKGGKAIEE